MQSVANLIRLLLEALHEVLLLNNVLYTYVAT